MPVLRSFIAFNFIYISVKWLILLWAPPILAAIFCYAPPPPLKFFSPSLLIIIAQSLIGDYEDHASNSPVDVSGTRNLIQLSLTFGKKGSSDINNIRSRARAFNLPQSSNNHKAELELMLTFF